MSRHRYEVGAWGPKNERGAYPPLCPIFKTPSDREARDMAQHMLDTFCVPAGWVQITYVSPMNPRYPDGPWKPEAVLRMERMPS